MKYLQFKEIFILLLLSVSLFFSSINSLPVLDRDEARYTQSSKQMIETDNYFSIKFQDELRSKKPIGIYWLQVFSVSIFSQTNENNSSNYDLEQNFIWKYRVVSSFAALLSVLLLYLLSRPLFGNKVAFYSSLILSSSLLFVAEAHIAKTDSVLVTLSILVFLTLLKYFNKKESKYPLLDFFFLWGGLGLSFLIKGPILLIIFFLTLLMIFIIKKEINWFKATKPFLGVMVMIIIGFSWFGFIPHEEQSNFLRESIVHDFIGKIIEVQENHGAYPGFHTLGVWVFLYPFSIFLIPAISFLKKNYQNNNLFFLIAWFVPSFVVMEIIPTKLPHYVLPLYPAISLVIGSLLGNLKKNISLFLTNWSLLGYVIFFLISNLLLLSLYLAVKNFGYFNVVINLSIIFLFLFNNSLFIFIFKKNIKKSFFYLVLLANFFTWMTYIIILPNLEKIWISHNIYNVLKTNSNLNSNSIAAIGYNEPSLVFELGSNIKIFKNMNNFAEKFDIYQYLIVEKSYYNRLNEIVNEQKLGYNLIKEIKGFNASKGKWIELYILKNK